MQWPHARSPLTPRASGHTDIGHFCHREGCAGLEGGSVGMGKTTRGGGSKDRREGLRTGQPWATPRGRELGESGVQGSDRSTFLFVVERIVPGDPGRSVGRGFLRLPSSCQRALPQGVPGPGPFPSLTNTSKCIRNGGHTWRFWHRPLEPSASGGGLLGASLSPPPAPPPFENSSRMDGLGVTVLCSSHHLVVASDSS